jgi:hypothetical protein
VPEASEGAKRETAEPKSPNAETVRFSMPSSVILVSLRL